MSKKVSRVILPAFDAPPSKSPRAPLKKRPGRPQREPSEPPRDLFARALLPAIEDMQILVGHAYALLDGPVADEAGIIEWLKRLQAELELSHDSVTTGRLSSRDQITMEDEEPAGLDDALSHAWDSGDTEWPDQPEFHLLARLAGYWVLQVQHRGRELVHLMIGAHILTEAADSLKKLNEIRYPLQPPSAESSTCMARVLPTT